MFYSITHLMQLFGAWRRDFVSHFRIWIDYAKSQSEKPLSPVPAKELQKPYAQVIFERPGRR